MIMIMMMMIIFMTVARGCMKFNVQSGQRRGPGIPHIPKILTMRSEREACGKFRTESRRP
jgi:hypothetical protein